MSNITVSCPVEPSFRVSQIAGLFDVTLEEKMSKTFEFEPPPLDAPWKIGLIVGPSGSGKSTIARHLFGELLYGSSDWPRNKAVIDGFGDLPIKEITKLLTIVGFSSPPSWIKPYSVLSNGERFRCDLAKALSLGIVNSTTIAFDEYTSVVDRQVAKIASAAIAKGIKTDRIPCRFVAVGCHYDIAEWLEPDWVLDTATGTVSGRRLRRPPIELQILRCERRAWKLFAKHHYLNAALGNGCRCYLALWNEEPVAFCAIIPVLGKKKHWRVSRLVTLPDYQGVGIGGRFLETLGDCYREKGERFGITASHPSVIAHCKRSPKWKTTNIMRTGSKRNARFGTGYEGSAGRVVVSFEYVPRKAE